MESKHLITHLPIPGGKAGAGKGQRWGWEAEREMGALLGPTLMSRAESCGRNEVFYGKGRPELVSSTPSFYRKGH